MHAGHPGVPILTGALRRPAAVVTVGAAVALGILGARYAGIEGPGRIDASFAAVVAEPTSPVRRPLRSLVRLVGPVPVVTVSAAYGVLALAARRPRLALVVGSGPALTGVATTLLQPLIGRTLNGGFALPSGHAGGGIALTLAAGLLVMGMTSRYAYAAAVISALGVLGAWALLTVALVANGLHYVTDTVASLCVALVVILGLALVVDRIADRSTKTAREIG